MGLFRWSLEPAWEPVRAACVHVKTHIASLALCPHQHPAASWVHILEQPRESLCSCNRMKTCCPVPCPCDLVRGGGWAGAGVPCHFLLVLMCLCRRSCSTLCSHSHVPCPPRTLTRPHFLHVHLLTDTYSHVLSHLSPCLFPASPAHIQEPPFLPLFSKRACRTCSSSPHTCCSHPAADKDENIMLVSGHQLVLLGAKSHCRKQ